MTDSKEREAFDLLPCPFCGCEEVNILGYTCVANDDYDPSDRLYPIAICSKCYAQVSGNNGDTSKQSAVKAWNRRSKAVAVPPSGFESLVWVRHEAFNALIKALHIAERKSIWTDDLDDAWDAFDFMNPIRVEGSGRIHDN